MILDERLEVLAINLAEVKVGAEIKGNDRPDRFVKLLGRQ